MIWVIDAIDECHANEDLLKVLVRVHEVLHIKIFITSRKGDDEYSPPPKMVTHLPANLEDTQKDIAAYLDDYSPTLETLIRRIILDKSIGRSLWATLVLRHLRSIRRWRR